MTTLLYVLTRTSGRPRFFQQLRRDLKTQTVPAVHVVHSDDPSDEYVEGDIIVRGDPIPVTDEIMGPELYNRRLLEALRGQPPGWVTFIDDDDTYTSSHSLQRILELCEGAGVDGMPIWYSRPNKPARFRGDLAKNARLNWGNAAFHTTHLEAAIQLVRNDRVSKPGRRGCGDWWFWLQMAQLLTPRWSREQLVKAQLGDGRGKRLDRPLLYILTRTSGRPRMFTALRANLASQPYRDFLHVVHSDDPNDSYVEGDIVVRGERQPITGTRYGPEAYMRALLQAVKTHGTPGWVLVMDDDDVYAPDALTTIASLCGDPDVMPVWKVRRENGRITPATWRGNPSTSSGRLCWENAAFHTKHLDHALNLVEPRDGNDGQVWAGLAARAIPEWHDAVLAHPQLPGRAGKGKGRRRDATAVITVAVPILGRPQRIREVMERFADPRLEVLFLPDQTDTLSVAELERLGARYSFAHPASDFGVPTFASKINHAYNVTSTPFLLYASDDITPEEGWVDAALAQLKDEGVGLLGTNDSRHHLVRRGLLATHGIVRRAYVEHYGSASLDGGPVMSEAYRHWCCDVEVTAVARARGAYRYASDVILRHSPGRDATYDLGRSFATRDRATRDRRIPTWPTLEGFAA